MAGNKTQPNLNLSAKVLLADVTPEQKQQDSLTLLAMLERISQQPAVVWGDSIIGFGQYSYQYQSGHSGEWMRIGFAARKQDISLYIMDGFDDKSELLAQLGKHKLGKCCLYIKHLKHINLEVLEQLLTRSWQNMQHPTTC